jgi:hypothetical protein
MALKGGQNVRIITVGLCTALIALGAFSLSAATAAERICRTALGAITVDDLRVPRGATCELNGTNVRGNVKVDTNAVLTATDVIVIGNIEGDRARDISVLSDSRVGGSVQVRQGGGATIDDSRVGNNVHFDRNRAAVSLLDSRVGGNVQARDNRGGVEIANNVINGNLQCSGNNPRPVGGGNVVGGNRQDQCRAL